MHLNPHAKCCSSKFSLKLLKKKENGGHLKPGNTLVSFFLRKDDIKFYDVNGLPKCQVHTYMEKMLSVPFHLVKKTFERRIGLSAISNCLLLYHYLGANP